ncbi:glycosyl transferase family 1 [Dulcicalothrix desertica PCC 7102]|uniref:Glycosyl transferase family 1 n=1 Tax=Dulcicalothrix desertica PCC 7102 TaxID=232991 RepID=A0A3S1DC20_9CYAN|nr:glycosyltransferase [Dulcicalothrix desertica]RUT07173.1 glycosyl transferase family 1 [Dulcicalothrix desertica PCC 7102]TWH61832.1 glycosyltransferase involved in cell wall biosynthesis [Dulcicalothrix desertica PCC 7102]
MQIYSYDGNLGNTTIENLNIYHVVASINENTGGPAKLVSDLTEALANEKISNHLFTLDYKVHGKQIISKYTYLHSYNADFIAQNVRGFHPKFADAMRKLPTTELSLIHNHGLWMFPNLYARQAANYNRIPLIISPHGMLESWSLKRSRFKKWLAWLMYERKNLSSAVLFNATSSEEVKSIRQLGFQQPIALIPNGLNTDSYNQQVEREVLTRLFPELNDKKWLLFLSRIHPKKGVDNLLFAWQKLQSQFPDWHLVIAGSDLIGYQAKLEALTEQLNLRQRVTFTGMLSGQEKISALSNADLFVLPTHSENFGIAIAESLACKVPVITTKGAPWEDLERYECGWWIDNNQQALITALAEAMKMSDEERKVMGLRGQALTKTKYSWNSIAKDTADVYRWILGGGELPDCIQLYSS